MSAVDEGGLRALIDDMGGDVEAVKELIQAYLEEAPRLLALGREAAARGEAAEAQRAFHTLKGTSATFGALELSAHARQLEQAARSGTLPSAEQLGEAERLLAAVRAALLGRLA